MKMLMIFYCLLALQSEAQTKQLFPNLDDPLERLVTRSETAKENVFARRQWNAEMDKIPNANGRMVDMFEAYLSQRSSFLPTILNALSMRTALTSEQLRRLTQPLEKIPVPVHTQDLADGGLITGVLGVLHSYPSPQHEKLGLKFLKDSDGVYQMVAMDLLAEIGGAESFKEVNKVVEDRHLRNAGYMDWIRDNMLEIRDKMQTRLVQETSGSQQAGTSFTDRNRKVQKLALNEKSTGLETQPLNLTAWVVICIVLAVVGLMWLGLKSVWR